MSARKKTAKLVGALLVIAASASISGVAQAQTTGWSWFDQTFSAPSAAAPSQRARTVRRAAPAQVSTAPVPAARPIYVSAAAPAQSETCFWCNPRRIYISGLSF